ncbi:MAG: hypothetical protein V1660_03345 [archaeon]
MIPARERRIRLEESIKETKKNFFHNSEKFHEDSLNVINAVLDSISECLKKGKINTAYTQLENLSVYSSIAAYIILKKA